MYVHFVHNTPNIVMGDVCNQTVLHRVISCDSMGHCEQGSLYELVSSSVWLPKWILAKSWKRRTCTDIGLFSVFPALGLAKWRGTRALKIDRKVSILN
jgi:hypothetical protein